MPRVIGKPNSYRNGESGIPKHPQITDTRTTAQVLHQVDHPELYEDVDTPGPRLHTPSDLGKYQESAYLTLSTKDTVTVHFRHTGIW